MAAAHPAASQLSKISIGEADLSDDVDSGDRAKHCNLQGVNYVITIAIRVVGIDV